MGIIQRFIRYILDEPRDQAVNHKWNWIDDVGIMSGQPADAIEDCDALYDDPPEFSQFKEAILVRPGELIVTTVQADRAMEAARARFEAAQQKILTEHAHLLSQLLDDKKVS